MAATGIDIQQVVNINTTVEAALPRAEFGTGLLITQQGDVLDGGGPNKARRFTKLTDVEDFFGADNDVSKDAKAWFSASPRPKALYIGRWAKSNVQSVIITQELTKTAAEFAAVTNGSLSIGGTNITGIDFTGDTSYSAVAATLQAKIAASFTGATATASTNRITIRFTTTSDPGEITGAGGTDLSSSEWLGLAAGAAGTTRVGSDSETIGQCVSRCTALATYGAPVALMLSRDVDSTDGQSPATSVKTLMRQYTQSGDYIFAGTESGSTVLGASDTSTSEMAKAKNASATKSTFIYTDSASKRPDIAALAKLSSQDFNVPNSVLTLVPKPLQGTEPTIVTEAEKDVILSKNGSLYTLVGGEPTFLGGRTAGGTWLDSEWFITWLKSRLETEIFNAERTSKRMNNIILTATVGNVMEAAFRSGGLQPGGRVSEAIKEDIIDVTQNQDFDGTLPTGYLLWVDRAVDQTDTDRAARVSRFKIWMVPSEAIHSVTGTIVLASG